MLIKTFSKKQAQILKFAYSNEGALVCDGAVRSGKTVVMSFAFVLWAMENFDRTNFAICGKTVSNAERNIIKPFQSLDGIPFSVTYRRGAKILTVRCAGRENYFYIFGGKDESSYALIQGITLAGVLFDEVALMPKSFVDQAIARTLSYQNAKLWFNCNPESPTHWFYREWIEGEKAGVKRLHFLMADNPILGQREIDRAKQLFSGVFYDRYILGRWVQAEGLVYDNYDRVRNTFTVLPELDPGRGYHYYISCDYGTRNPFSAGLWALDTKTGTAYRVAEYYYNGRDSGGRTDVEHYAQLETLAAKIPEGEILRGIVIDPSAASMIETIKRARRFRVMPAKNEVLPGIARTRSALSLGKIQIHESCSDLLREIQLYSWDEKAAGDAVIKENDHAMDDMRYFVNTVLQKYIKFDL